MCLACVQGNVGARILNLPGSFFQRPTGMLHMLVLACSTSGALYEIMLAGSVLMRTPTVHIGRQLGSVAQTLGTCSCTANDHATRANQM